MSVIIGNRYCLHVMNLFNWRKSLIQHTLLYFLRIMNEGNAHSLSCCTARTPILMRWLRSFLKVFKWIWGTGYGLECPGWHLDQCQYVPFCVDKLQEFHWSSYYFSVALKANLLFDVHLDEWVLSRPQLHLSFHTWHPECLLQIIQANLHWRSCLWLGCETCLPWHQILFESKPPGGWSGMEQSNHSMFSSD